MSSKRLALVAFPDDWKTARLIAKQVGADEVAIFTGDRNGLLEAAKFLVSQPKSAGASDEDVAQNKLVVSSSASESFIDSCRKIRKAGVSFNTAAIPSQMRPGDGYGVVPAVSIEAGKAIEGRKEEKVARRSRRTSNSLEATIEAAKPVSVASTVSPASPVAQPAEVSYPAAISQVHATGQISSASQLTASSAPTGLPLVSDPPLDDYGLAPYQSQLPDPMDVSDQVAREIAHASFGSLAFRPMTSDNRSFLLWVTGVAGGSGKTTLAYLMGNIFASAMKRAGRIDERPVFVIEADFENSKWASRLDIPRGNDISHYVHAMRRMATDTKTTSSKKFREMKEQAIDDSTYILESGLRVIACPYEVDSNDIKPISRAIGEIIEYLMNLKGIDPIIIVDGSVPKILDPVSVAMASLAHAAVLTSSRGNNDDVDRALKIMKSQLRMNMSRVSLFFMKSTQRRFEDYISRFAPYACAGFLPNIAELEDQSGEHGAWVGNLQESEVLQRTLLNVAQAIEGVHHFDEIKHWDSFVRSQSYATRGGGVLQFFRRFRR